MLNAKIPEGYKLIPGLQYLHCNREGMFFNSKTGHYTRGTVNKQYYSYRNVSNYIIDKDKALYTTQAHRLIAHTWIPNPENLPIINHKDNNGFNNHVDNLEWRDHQYNNQHVVDIGQMKESIKKIRVRDYVSGIVATFNSTAQAKRYMNIDVRTDNRKLIPTFFGGLINQLFEVRYSDCKLPWCYEKISEPFRSTFYIIVTYPDGSRQIYYRFKELLRDLCVNDKELNEFANTLVGNTGRNNLTARLIVAELEKIFPDYDFELERFDRNLFERELGTPKAQPTKLIGYDTVTGQKVIFDSFYKASKLTHCDKRLIRESIKETKLVSKRWLFAELENKQQIETLKEKITNYEKERN